MLQYANAKYQLVSETVFAENFNYGGAGTNQGLTCLVFGNPEVDVYDPAFSNENVVASTIGHENEHFRKGETSFLGSSKARAEAEVAAHTWELSNASATGISRTYQNLTQHFIDYHRGIRANPDDPSDFYPNPAP